MLSCRSCKHPSLKGVGSGRGDEKIDDRSSNGHEIIQERSPLQLHICQDSALLERSELKSDLQVPPRQRSSLQGLGALDRRPMSKTKCHSGSETTCGVDLHDGSTPCI